MTAGVTFVINNAVEKIAALTFKRKMVIKDLDINYRFLEMGSDKILNF